MASENSTLHGLMTLLGRALIAIIFVMAGIGKFVNPDQTAAYIATQHLPYPLLLTYAAASLETVAGLMVLLGYRTRLGAFFIFLFIIPTTFIFHDFWTFDKEQVEIQMSLFLQNGSIMGGLLYIMAYGAGKIGFDK